MNLRRFAFWNIWFWLANLAAVNVIYLWFPDLWTTLAQLYLIDISVLALVLSCLAWWQSCRVEVKQDEATN